MSTTVFATKRALRDKIKSVLPDVQVSYADPGDRRRRTSVWLGPEVEDLVAEQRALKQGAKRQEDYLLHVWVEVIKPGSVEDVESAAEDIVSTILAAIDQDPGLSRAAPGLLFVVGHGMNVDTTETTDGIRVNTDLIIRAKGRP